MSVAMFAEAGWTENHDALVGVAPFGGDSDLDLVYAMNEGRQVLRDILDDEGMIDMDAPHVPLLLIGAELDEIIPSNLVRRNAHAYSDERSHSEFAEFTGHGHFICGEPGWEEVAEKISNWLDAHLNAERA